MIEKNETARRLGSDGGGRKVWAGEEQILFSVKDSCKKKLAAVSKVAFLRQ